jgi:lipooligosaccharide transport system permease protein
MTISAPVFREALPRAKRFRRPAWVRSLSYFFLQYRRTWRSSLTSNFVYPTLYLTAMGVGLGHLVNAHVGRHAATLGGLSYLSFLAPGVLASSAMQIGVQESTYPVLGAIRWTYAYVAMVATPLRAVDVVRGQLAFIAFRLLVTCGTFALIATAFGAIHSVQAVLAVFAAALCGMAFAAPIAAYSARQEYDVAFPVLNRLIVIPLFLFSGTFFPIHQLPRVLQIVALGTPLYHGVALSRSLAEGKGLVWASLVHVGYLAALAGAGYFWAIRSFERRLSR